MKLKGFLLIAALSAMLLLGQSIAVTALNNNNSIGTNAILNDKEFSVDIYFVGTGPTEGARVNDTDGAYNFVSDSAITGVLLKTNITGYTTVTTDNNITVGQLFLIIDGEINVVGPGYTSSAGAVISLSAGVHVVAFLYVGNGNEGFQYATDSVIIQIADSEEDMNEFSLTDVDLQYDVTDSAVADKDWAHGSPVWYEDGYSEWTRNFSYTPKNEVKVFVNAGSDSTELTTGTSFDFRESGAVIVLNGSIDTTGVDTLSFAYNGTNPDESETFAWDILWDTPDQQFGSWADMPLPVDQTTTVGYEFLVDARGLTLIEDTLPTNISVIQTPKDPSYQSLTYMGVLALSDYGLHFDSLWGSSHDLDGFTKTTDEDDPIDYEYSFDFVATMGGVYMFTAEYSGLPGFQATETAFALVTLGIVAFVIPRFRKEEK